MSGFTIELPMPPSVNKFVGRLGNSSSVVRQWIRSADASMMSKGKIPEKVQGYFNAAIVFDSGYFGKRDIDNSLKPLLDYLQSRELIDNDRFCYFLEVTWGHAPEGCIVEISPSRGEK